MNVLYRVPFRILPRRSRNLRLFSQANEQMIVFDRDLKQRQRKSALSLEGGDYYDYLREESARQICERIEDITRDFPIALDLGCYKGYLYKEINSRQGLSGAGGVGGIETLRQLDMSLGVDDSSLMTKTKINNDDDNNGMNQGGVESIHINGDEENPLQYVEQHSQDLVLSNLNLHWINDLPNTLTQIREVLKPDGCFIGSLLGGSTLNELRHCLYLAEQERRGGISPHTSPLVTPSDMAGLMQGARFALPTIDIETVTISYPDAFSLMEHLSLMGEGNAALNRQFHVGKETFLAAAALYQELYGLEDGSIPATFQMIYVIGWAPHESQPQCAKRGSANKSMKSINNADMVSKHTGEREEGK
jgi:NADH dehydrogenase [ubiquinone] 1 alpha subcomplex assembly factor 5